jgi:hypothetical protein
MFDFGKNMSYNFVINISIFHFFENRFDFFEHVFKMEISTKTALLIAVLVLLGLFVWGGCKMPKGGQKDKFTRTCLTADTNCKFVRSPVDYAYKTQTEVPEKIGRDYPHLMAYPADELHPLEDGITNLIKDEDKLWNQEELYKQYTHDYQGCGNGKPYIVNDEKTRFLLREVGDEAAVRMMYSMKTPEHGPRAVYPALTEQDIIRPEPFDRQYGGSGFIAQQIGV